jgi:hypothetical protein
LNDQPLPKCPTCGEAAGKTCRDYSAIPFRATKISRFKDAMRAEAPPCQPHAARLALVRSR